MKCSAYYDTQTMDGGDVSGRILKAAAMLRKHKPAPTLFIDIGCGKGVAAKYIGEQIGAKRTIGVDISVRAVEDARSNGIEARQVDMDNDPLPFTDGSVDAIHCGEVIEHVVDTDRLMDEIKRVLSPTGVCALSTPNLAAWHNRLALLLGYQPFLSQVSFRFAVGHPGFAPGGAGGHLRMFTRFALLEFLERHGVEVFDEQGVSVYDIAEPPGSRIAKLLFSPVDRLLTHVTPLACDTLVAFRHRRSNS